MIWTPGWLSGWASAFSSGNDPRALGLSPTSGFPHGACFSLSLCLCLSLSWINKILKKIILRTPGWLSGWASAFSSGHDLGVWGSSPTLGFSQGACFFLYVFACLSLMNKSLKKFSLEIFITLTYSYIRIILQWYPVLPLAVLNTHFEFCGQTSEMISFLHYLDIFVGPWEARGIVQLPPSGAISWVGPSIWIYFFQNLNF